MHILLDIQYLYDNTSKHTAIVHINTIPWLFSSTTSRAPGMRFSVGLAVESLMHLSIHMMVRIIIGMLSIAAKNVQKGIVSVANKDSIVYA